MTRIVSRTVLLCGVAAASLFAAPAFAAADKNDSTAVTEVVVTARQRNEEIQKVPAQVTAFTAADIADKGITNPADFLDAVPNVTFISTQNAGTSFLVIRGVSQARNSEPSAAIIVDGVPMTQPAEFNQSLLDVQQIEVLKGPQGAVYGRNAIGGAILITTAAPADHWSGSVVGGWEDGHGGKFQGAFSGPVTDTLKMRAALYYFDTQGHLKNQDAADAPSAQRNADPVQDLNVRFNFVWTPTKAFSADLRLSSDLLNTRGLYYTIPALGSANFNNPNYTSQPINLNNSGKDDRKIYDGALKLNYNTKLGTLTSITGYSTVWEILTGDGWTFDPFGQSQIHFDYSQAQFLKARTFTQELRLTSPTSGRFRWIAGGEVYATTRFISTGNMFDLNNSGVTPVYYTPNPLAYQPHGQISFLADSQTQFAWALYFDSTYDITNKLELSANFRFDSDHRRDTTDTPQGFLNASGIPAHTGDSRAHTWSQFQPQAVLKYQFTSDFNVYGSYSRGFRSGGFNQIGVATAARAAGFDNVGDSFDAETTDTFEIGFKSRLMDRRLTFNGSVYTTKDHGDYYFVFLASNSTQNLGNIKTTRFTGFDLDAQARLSKELTAFAGFGYTHSRIEEFPGASSSLVVGSKAPLVSDYTFNIGAQWTHRLVADLDLFVRVDDNVIGPTTFVIPVPAAGEPTPIQRNAVNLFDLRAGLKEGRYTLTFWSKNLFNKTYNTEYSTGGFHFKGQPRSLGLDLGVKF